MSVFENVDFFGRFFDHGRAEQARHRRAAGEYRAGTLPRTGQPTGLPGVAYVQLDPQAPWPAHVEVKLAHGALQPPAASAQPIRHRWRRLTDDDHLDRMPMDQDLDRLQWTTVLYYLHETNPDNGLVRDKTDPAAPCSIAAVGLALATIPVIVERGVVIRKFAAKIARRRLRSLLDLPQGPEPDAAGYKGFFYHFLDIETGRRVWDCELSTLDSAFLFAGVLTCATYFDADTADEAEVRRLADALYRRADWDWARDGGPTLTHGWRPGTGFLPHRYQGYDEGLLLYVLGLGSPTHPLPPESYAAYCATYQWKQLYGRELLYSGPLFTHQLSHLWIDFRGLRDAFMREHGSDYFENSRQATYRAAGVRGPQPDAVRGLRGALLGVHGLRRPRLGQAGRRRGGAAVLRLHRPRRPVRPGRRHRRPVGRGRLPAVRPGDRHPDRPQPGRHESGRPGPAVRVPVFVQPDVSRGRQPDWLVGDAVPVRHRPGAGGADDRELPHRPDMGPHAPLPARGGRACGGPASRAVGCSLLAWW